MTHQIPNFHILAGPPDKPNTVAGRALLDITDHPIQSILLEAILAIEAEAIEQAEADLAEARRLLRNLSLSLHHPLNEGGGWCDCAIHAEARAFLTRTDKEKP